MSTRTIISAKMKGKVYSIYCHHDGYPSHLAPLFLEIYNCQEKVEALIMLGDTSAIYKTLEDCQPYAKSSGDYEINKPEITDEWKRDDDADFLYEYYWDGEQWFYCHQNDELKPLSQWKDN